MSNNLTIVNIGSGNLHSVEKAFQHVTDENNLGFTIHVTNKPEDLKSATHIVLPGQGAFGDCMNGLHAIKGMHEALEEAIIKNTKPYLGICIGMQMMVDIGLEHGKHKGLGWIPGQVIPLPANDPKLKIPHMGWNDLIPQQSPPHLVLRSTDSSSENPKDFYFVHSFMVECKERDHVLATANYGQNFPAIIGRDNMIGMQFHPEKSHNNGLALLKDFLQWKP